MGCFNTTGFLSKLPILYGDRVVCFLAKINPEYGYTPYYPFELVAPICFPIYGEYNDYGSIEDVDDSPIVKLIEKIGGKPIDEICDAIAGCCNETIKSQLKRWGYGEENQSEWSKEECQKVQDLLKLFNKEEDVPTLLFEHEEVYNKFTEGNPDWKWWNEDKPHFDVFYEEIESFKDFKYAKKTPLKIFGSADGYFSNIIWEIIDECKDENGEVDNEKLHKELKDSDWVNIEEKYKCEPLIHRSQQPNAMQLVNDLSLTDFCKLMIDCKDEVAKFFNFYMNMSCFPMYVGLSKTAGEQSYDRSVINKFYTVVNEQLEKFNERCKKWEDEQEEYEDEDV